MSRHYDKQIKIEKTMKGRLLAIFRKARKEHTSHAEMLEARTREVYHSPLWEHATRPTKERVGGYWEGLYDAHQDNIVFAYDVGGKRYLLGSPEYKALGPRKVCLENTWSGYVYREAPERVFYGGPTLG